MTQSLFVIGAAMFVVLGMVHGALTVRDLSTPRWFAPTDDSVRRSMAAAPLLLSRRMTVWRAWLGFNLSHSLGLLVFGGVLGGIALDDFALVASSPLLRWVAIIASSSYTLLAIRFWFWVPASAAAVGCASFVLASLLL